MVARRASLERRLVVGVLLLFLVPTGVAGVVLLVMYRQGLLETPGALFATVLVGFATMMTYLAIMTRSIGRSLVRTVQEIQLGTELMVTVNPAHRLAVRTGDELEALADEINRLADHLQTARAGLAGDIAVPSHALPVEGAATSDPEGPVPPAPGAGFVGAGLLSGTGLAERVAERPDLADAALIEAMEQAVGAIDLERPLDALTCVVLDTETTGLHPERGDRVVSVAGVRVRDGAVRRAEVFDALVNPRRPIPEASVRFHGITDALVAAVPPMSEVLPAFLRFADGAVLVGHQVWFDLRFLAAEARALGLPPLARPILDTLALSAVVHGPLPGHGLDAVAARLGVTVRGRHSALGDALATAEVFVRLVELLRKRGVVTLGQALEAARRARPALRDRGGDP